MAENTNSEPDDRDSENPEEARESGAYGVGGGAENYQANNRGFSVDNVGEEDGDGAFNPGRAEDQGEFDAAPSEDGADQSEGCAVENDDQRPGEATSDIYQVFGKEFRDSQAEEFDVLLLSLGEDTEGLHETKDQMVGALLMILGSLPGTGLDEAAEATAKAVEKKQEDSILRLEELRGDIAEEVDFAKWRHGLTDDRDRRSGKGDGGMSPFE